MSQDATGRVGGRRRHNNLARSYPRRREVAAKRRAAGGGLQPDLELALPPEGVPYRGWQNA